jgi:hypothetical protein
LIERATGKVEIGSYVKNQMHGEWKYKYLNGNEDSEFYMKGKVLSKEEMQNLLKSPAVAGKGSTVQQTQSSAGQSPVRKVP